MEFATALRHLFSQCFITQKPAHRGARGLSGVVRDAKAEALTFDELAGAWIVIPDLRHPQCHALKTFVGTHSLILVVLAVRFEHSPPHIGAGNVRVMIVVRLKARIVKDKALSYTRAPRQFRSEEHTSELQSLRH